MTIAHRAVLLVIVVLSSALTIGAMRRTSTTFDEITLMADGARGFETGTFDLVTDHPPLPKVLYGLAVSVGGLTLPDEAYASNRWEYSRQLLWGVGNDPEAMAFRARLVAVVFAAGLILVVFAFVYRNFGVRAGLLAAVLVGFAPDVLAHGGVAYNDVPLALTFFTGLWAVDAFARVPTKRSGAVAGLAVALALATKYSAISLLPAAVVVLALEAVGNRDRRRWATAFARGALVAVLVGYIALVGLYGGDSTLSSLFHGVFFKVEQARASTDGLVPYLMGTTSERAPWYFFIVAFFFKTPVALHLLLLVSAFVAVRRRTRLRSRAFWTSSKLRMPLVGLVVFGSVLLLSGTGNGFRYALPALPLLLAVVAVCSAHVWEHARRSVRAVLVVITVAYAVSPVWAFPHFLAYTSEYVGDKDRAYEVFVDSNLDWGQGLLELRDYMDENDIPSVYLSYFGSAVPEGYGIEYRPLMSWHILPDRSLSPGVSAPEYAVISATNLVGIYLPGDPFAAFREAEPVEVLGHTMFVYPIAQVSD